MAVVPKFPTCPVTVLMLYRTYRSVRYRYERLYRFRLYRYGHRTELTQVSGRGLDMVPNFPKCPVPVSMPYQAYRSVQYRYWCTEITEVSSIGIDIVPNLPKCPVTVLISYRSYRSVLYRCWCCAEITEVSSRGIVVVPNLPKCPVPVWKSVPVPVVPVSISYRTYGSVRYWYWCRVEPTEVSSTGIKVTPNLPNCSVPAIPAVYTGGRRRYVRYRTHPCNLACPPNRKTKLILIQTQN